MNSSCNSDWTIALGVGLGCTIALNFMLLTFLKLRGSKPIKYIAIVFNVLMVLGAFSVTVWKSLRLQDDPLQLCQSTMHWQIGLSASVGTVALLSLLSIYMFTRKHYTPNRYAPLPDNNLFDDSTPSPAESSPSLSAMFNQGNLSQGSMKKIASKLVLLAESKPWLLKSALNMAKENIGDIQPILDMIPPHFQRQILSSL